jgi:hypothetical protein
MRNTASKTQTVYTPDMWPDLVETGRREELCQWLHANGIDPDDVPINAEISIEPTKPKGAQLIRYTVYLRDTNGRKYCGPATDDAAQEERTVPLLVQPPRWTEA